MTGHDPAEAQEATWMFEEIAALSRDTEGVSRPAYSKKETEVLGWLERYARELSLVTWYDTGRNLHLALPQDAAATRRVLIGSHVDSVPRGGNYDGLAGVLAGLMCLTRAGRAGQSFARPVHVIAMRAEESAWFGPCYIASKALTGMLATDELDAQHKGDGRSLAAHMVDAGVEMASVRAGRPLIQMDDILAFLELHIEQGPLLIGKDTPAAVVTGIRGNLRYQDVICTGHPGHSGAVPRAFRQDPVMAMADLLMRLDDSWAAVLQHGDDLVVTSGIVHTNAAYNAMTRIADEVRFSLDIRSQSMEVLRGMSTLLHQETDQIARDRRVRFDLGPCAMTAPALMDQQLVKDLIRAADQVGLPALTMASGGGHDAAVFANAGVPSAMVFVRNQNGSHNPQEAMDIEDFLSGVSLLYTYLMARPGAHT